MTRLKLGQTEIFKSIFLNHFEECTSYLIKQFGAQYDDAYDSSMATLLRFRKRLVEDKIRYGNLRFLFTRMASQHYQRSFKNKAVALNEGYDIPEETTNNFEEADISQLESAWKKLDLKCKELLKMNYYQNMKLAEIASIQNINAATLRKQKERCKAKLIEYFQK